MKGNNKVGIWLVLGTGMGIAIGSALDNVALGITFGSAAGLLIGSIASKSNANEDDMKEE